MSLSRSRYRDSKPYVTKDGTLIRELMHPDVHGNRLQSLAEAVVKPGQESARHLHRQSEELYHITAGEGHMTLGDEELVVQAGDTICIPPSTPHSIRNTGAKPLCVLCCSSPAYSHKDTELW